MRDTKFSVLTFYVWGLKIGPCAIAPGVDRRMELCRRQLLALGPDIVALQEVWSDEIARFFIQQLPYPYHTYLPDRRLFRGQLGNGLLILSKQVITGDGVLSYSCHAGAGEFLANKGILWSRLQTPTGVVYLVNTHLGAGKKAGHMTRRMKQVDELLSFLSTLPAVHPVVLAGDFNFNDDTPEYRRFVEGMKGRFDEKVVDAYVRMHPFRSDPTFFLDRTYKTGCSAHNRDERIDFLFVLYGKRSRSAIGVLDSRVVFDTVNPPLSDHAGVLAAFSMKKKASLDEWFSPSATVGEIVNV